MKNEDEKIVAFLNDYKEVCLKHNAIVTACGCCDSPYIFMDVTKDSIEYNILHLKAQSLEANEDIDEYTNL